MIENIENKNSKNNGIVKIKQNGIEYTVWTHANVVIKYIKDELKKRFPEKLIVKELNRIDLSIPEENLPVEIQATISGRTHMQYGAWEDRIKRQIDQNIAHGRCWFFFDSELLRAMKDASSKMSINMDWFRKLMKEGKLKVFTVSHYGIIEEKEYKDFDFLAEMSQTCKVAAETDDMILNKNKMNIFTNIVRWHGFTQDEIDEFEDTYKNRNDIHKDDKTPQFLKKQTDKRAKLYGNILHATGNLSAINRVFEGDIIKNTGLSDGAYIGIFESEGIIVGKHNMMKFVDYSASSQYFPEYIRHKDKWDEFKEKWLSTRQFEGIIKGNVDYNWYKEYENTNNSQHQNDFQIDNGKDIDQCQTNNDKGVNIKIDNKDQIININIKTKQITIEDSWG